MNDKKSIEIINDLNKNVNEINLSFLQWLSKTKDTETLQLSKSFKTDFGIIINLTTKEKILNVKILVKKIT